MTNEEYIDLGLNGSAPLAFMEQDTYKQFRISVKGEIALEEDMNKDWHTKRGALYESENPCAKKRL